MLHSLLVGFGDDVTLEHKAGQMRYARQGRLFCILKPTAKRVDIAGPKARDRTNPAGFVRVGFRRFSRARSKRVLSARGRLPFLPYLVEVEAPGDVDSELRAWLRESYEIALE